MLVCLNIHSKAIVQTYSELRIRLLVVKKERSEILGTVSGKKEDFDIGTVIQIMKLILLVVVVVKPILDIVVVV